MDIKVGGSTNNGKGGQGYGAGGGGGGIYINAHDIKCGGNGAPGCVFVICN